MPYPTNPQPCAVTGAIRAASDFRTGFWCFCDNANLDAPFCLPSGATSESFYDGERFIIGGLTIRQGAFE